MFPDTRIWSETASVVAAAEVTRRSAGKSMGATKRNDSDDKTQCTVFSVCIAFTKGNVWLWFVSSAGIILGYPG